MSTDIREPTGEECENRSVLFDDGRSRAVAMWYPQMGGYCGKCVVVFQSGDNPPDGDGELPCFEAFVWHDGEFPFGEDDGRGPVRVLHHCDPAQFVHFGAEVMKAMTAAGWRVK